MPGVDIEAEFPPLRAWLDEQASAEVLRDSLVPLLAYLDSMVSTDDHAIQRTSGMSQTERSTTLPTTSPFPTFGFEAEYGCNTDAVVTALHHEGLCYNIDKHGYHCDCEGCEFSADTRHTFRGQNDSSCDGEIISHPFSDWGDARVAMLALQRACVDGDAEPALVAGFHVHVAQPVNEADRGRVLVAALNWSDVLREIAGGRFSLVRGFNTAAPHAYGFWQDEGYDLSNWQDNTNMVNFYNAVRYDNDFDRHSDLNPRTRHRTMEFRHWNSTRVAWRMELFCQLSVAFATPHVVTELLKPTVRTKESLVGVLRACNLNKTADLTERQLDYLNRYSYSDAAAIPLSA